ncbi:hypothetical protein ACLF3G_23990 [Falsiroseomonas sp. HC035]|uniref:hypothetical protein n=1 Tax=Falsiroseomonas sp. HC035 TaxID=3390999 RepID=UPI003D315259
MTVVQARGRRLAKLIHADRTAEPYDRTKTVDLLTMEVADLDDLAALLRGLVPRRDCCIVRGAVIDPRRSCGVRRLSHPDPETGEAPTLREVARRWVALDVDSVPLLPGTDPHDLAACARSVAPMLPAGFHRRRVVVQATASHGIKPGARLRLWYWYSRPMTSAENKALFAGSPVDRSLFSAAQPHYTAAPIFDGWADPLPHRLAVVDGVPLVDPPPANVLPPTTSPTQPLGRPLVAFGVLRGGSATARLAGLLCTVRTAAEGERHRTLFWASCRVGEMVAAGEVGADAAVRVLAEAAIEGGGRDQCNAEATARDGIARGAAEVRE